MNYTQYLVITYRGKESEEREREREKMNMYQICLFGQTFKVTLKKIFFFFLSSSFMSFSHIFGKGLQPKERIFLLEPLKLGSGVTSEESMLHHSDF